MMTALLLPHSQTILYMDIYVKNSLISIFSLFLVFNNDFIIYIYITCVATIKTQIRSHTKYLVQTYNIIVLILY